MLGVLTCLRDYMFICVHVYMLHAYMRTRLHADPPEVRIRGRTYSVPSPIFGKNAKGVSLQASNSDV